MFDVQSSTNTMWLDINIENNNIEIVVGFDIYTYLYIWGYIVFFSYVSGFYGLQIEQDL